VFDADSFDTHAFDQRDAAMLHRLLAAVGLTAGPPPVVEVV
jgi:putative methionine-R-sulfoxide reductase with GAF domain